MAITEAPVEASPDGGVFFRSAVVDRPELKVVSPLLSEPLSPAGDFNRFSEGYWIDNGDVVPTGTGLVYRESVWSVASNGEASQGVVTIVFDGRRHGEHWFGWQMSCADILGRTVHNIQGDHNTTVAKKYVIDHQGKFQTESELSGWSWEVHAVMAAVKQRATSQVAEVEINDFRNQREKTELEIGNLYRTDLNKLSPAKFKEEVKRREEHADAIGFVAIKPYQPPASVPYYHQERLLYGSHY